jgi:hypothetical protein
MRDIQTRTALVLANCGNHAMTRTASESNSVELKFIQFKVPAGPGGQARPGGPPAGRATSELELHLEGALQPAAATGVPPRRQNRISAASCADLLRDT